MIKRVGTLVLLCLLAFFVQGQPDLARLLDSPGLRNAAVGIAIKRVSDGKMILAHNAEMALTPASVTKLFPTIFALQVRGGDFRYKTPVFYTGQVDGGALSGDIVVKAGGDPCLESRYFPDHVLLQPVVEALKKAGIHEINGKIKVEGTGSGTNIPGSWTWEDVSNYYAALCLPFNYKDNTCIYELKTGAAGTSAQLKSITPALPGIKVVNQVRASVESRDNAWVYGGPYSKELYIQGTVPQNRSSFQVKGAMHNPDIAFVNELSVVLKENGIPVRNGVTAHAGETELLTLYSPPLKEIVFHTNKSSVNLFAEALGKVVDSGNWPDKLIGLLRKAGVSTEGIILKDACGLSPLDAVPARVFTDLLVYAAPVCGDNFMRSLPVAGRDGGLSGYGVNAPGLKERMKAKTGSMSGVRCLSGYLTTRSGEQLAFTVLINHYTCTTAQLQRIVGQFLETCL